MICMVGFDKYLLVIFRISKEGLTGGAVWHFFPVNLYKFDAVSKETGMHCLEVKYQLEVHNSSNQGIVTARQRNVIHNDKNIHERS